MMARILYFTPLKLNCLLFKSDTPIYFAAASFKMTAIESVLKSFEKFLPFINFHWTVGAKFSSIVYMPMIDPSLASLPCQVNPPPVKARLFTKLEDKVAFWISPLSNNSFLRTSNFLIISPLELVTLTKFLLL
ncbi:hypothetical protein D3C86_1412780 [compost metagenome]